MTMSEVALASCSPDIVVKSFSMQMNRYSQSNGSSSNTKDPSPHILALQCFTIHKPINITIANKSELSLIDWVKHRWRIKSQVIVTESPTLI